MDLSNLNQFNAPNLPPPDQSSTTGTTAGVQVPTGSTAGTTIPTGTQSVGGSTAGVNAAKGAATAVGINPLIVDQNILSTIASGNLPSSGASVDITASTGMQLPNLSLTDVHASLGKITDDLDAQQKLQSRFKADVQKVVAHLKGNIQGKKSSSDVASTTPSAGESVSRAVSPTGVTTTTMTEEVSNGSGGTTTETTTSTSGSSSESSSASSSSTSSTTSTSASSSSNNGDCNFSLILAEIAELTNQESATMSTQEEAQISAIGQQAQDTVNQANLMLQGANSMLTMGICGLAFGLGTSAYSMAGVASASKEGDQAETEAMQKQATSVEDTSEKSMSNTIFTN
jgi:hypothetical protein